MKTLLIVLLSFIAILIYIAIGVLLLELAYKLHIFVEYADEDDTEVILFGIFWPLLLVLFIILLPFIFVNIIRKRIKNRIKIKQIRKKK